MWACSGAGLPARKRERFEVTKLGMQKHLEERFFDVWRN